ncbi:hypothetical protein DPX16_9253 [Anabarilius grahami]|uniref:Uncharacterized protein n=1 Tax=Anabarilius grahami TaxID=495550 RepID=A0A3N0Y645_ANAGA|nr:hypothetical protein DPX16_9253 [Anabarilius grahami]
MSVVAHTTAASENWKMLPSEDTFQGNSVLAICDLVDEVVHFAMTLPKLILLSRQLCSGQAERTEILDAAEPGLSPATVSSFSPHAEKISLTGASFLMASDPFRARQDGGEGADNDEKEKAKGLEVCRECMLE